MIARAARLLRRIQTPRVMFACAAALVVCCLRVCSLDAAHRFSYSSWLARTLINDARFRGMRVTPYAGAMVHLREGPPWTVNWDTMSVTDPKPLDPNDPAPVFFTRFRTFEWRRGWFDPVMEYRGSVVLAYRSDGLPVTPEQFAGIARFLESVPEYRRVIECAPDVDTLPWTQQSHDSIARRERRIVWIAVVVNGLAVLSLLGMALSSPFIVRAVVRRTRAQRLARGLCPFCSYDRGSTPAQSPCPECGKPPVIAD